MHPTTCHRGAAWAVLLAMGLSSHSWVLAVEREWNVNGDGSWTVAGNWDPIGIPGATDQAFIRNRTAASSPVVVTIPGGITQAVNGLTLDDTGVATKHELFVSNNTFFDIFGDILNNGEISLNSTGSATQLRLRSNTMMSGTGRFVLGDSGANGLSAPRQFYAHERSDAHHRGDGQPW